MTTPRHLWILDNGHGGSIDGVYQTAGKRSPIWPDGRQLYEGVWNRQIVAGIARLLTHHGHAVHVLVPEQTDVPLSERVARVNALVDSSPIMPVLVSVHANAGGGTGWEVWTSPGETASDRIASVFARHAAERLGYYPIRADYADGDVDKEARFTMLTKTRCPAVLTENLFMDQLGNFEFMASDRGKRAIVALHVDAIAEVEREGV